MSERHNGRETSMTGVFLNWGHLNLLSKASPCYTPPRVCTVILFWLKPVPVTAWPETKAKNPGLRSVCAKRSSQLSSMG